MVYPLLRLYVGGVFGSALALGCGQAHWPYLSGTVTVPAPQMSNETPHDPAPVARAAAPHPAEVKVLEVLPAAGASEEQEVREGRVVSAPVAVPPGVVGGVREEAETQATAYGHAPDYRWLTGELRYSPARGAWCLRYAPEDEEDRHGGSVTLVGAGAMTGLQPGEAVRVEGEMIDPETREPSPPYRVHGLRPLPRAELPPSLLGFAGIARPAQEGGDEE
ncbi:MAG TPA: hypothetical protein VKA46_00665 [Gemmataceae bacterium]|nr:hypothetical protein [Gemmataceae bacterium]